MKNKLLLVILFIFLCVSDSIYPKTLETQPKIEETIFVFGGDINLKFVQYVTDLTNKTDPKIIYIPTASADNEKNIEYWKTICTKIGINSFVLKVWVSSSPANKSFEDILLNADAIVVGGGNTLNMLGIWKAQGIDTILHKALKQGIILAGGSAGSICWFRNGISDSRPVNLSMVTGLGYLPYSNCPHYSDQNKRDLYHQMILNNNIEPGYACDDLAGILFKNGKAIEFMSQSDKHNSYYVDLKKGIIQSEKIPSKYLINKNALSERDYSTKVLQKRIIDLLNTDNEATPLNAFVAATKKFRLGKKELTEIEKNKILNITVPKIFIYENKLAAVINNAYDDFYGLWYFYNNNGIWESIGEDIGGVTLFECEITFREKAKMVLEKANK